MSSKRIMLVASAGGHWIQLLRMRPAWAAYPATYVTTEPGSIETIRAIDGDARFIAVTDANLDKKLHLVLQLVQLVLVMIRNRPDVIISTGASVGYFAIRLGRLLGARTVWVDSIANAEVLSTSGQQIGKHADLWLTQWPHLAKPEGPFYHGSVL